MVPPSENLRDAQRRLARERFIDAAIAVCSERGYSAATIDDIALAAGAGRATFYQHFDAKWQVVAAIIDRLIPSGEAVYAKLATEPAPTRADIRIWVEELVDWWAERRDEADVAERAAAVEPDLEASVHAAFERRIQTIADLIVLHGRRDPADARVRALLLFTQIQGTCWYWIVCGWRFDRDRLLDALADSWADELGLPS